MSKFTMKVCISMVTLLRVLYLYITFNKNVILNYFILSNNTSS